MNTQFPTVPRYFTLFASLALLLPAATRAADDDESHGSTARVQFSDAARPGTLRLSLPWAEARITGTDGREVIVTSTLDQKGHNEVDHEGFRRLDEDVTFELTEKDNVATITIAGDNMWAAHGAEFEIKVPRNTNLVIRTEAGGDIEVNGVEGDLDINSMNGEVTLRDIVSSAVVNTMNGEISASFKQAPTKTVSLSSMNGEIDLRLPADTKANLRMRTHNGSIRTNFPDGVLKAKTEKATRGKPADARTDLTIIIKANGDITVGDDPSPVSLTALEQITEKTFKEDHQAVVLVRSTHEANLKITTAVMNACRKAGLNKIRLASDDASPDARPAPRPEAGSREVERQLARESARMDREHAKIAHEVTKAVAEANQIAVEVARELDRNSVHPVPPVPAIAPMPPLPNFGGKSIVGTLNGGGIDIKLTSMNGTITLRESK